MSIPEIDDKTKINNKTKVFILLKKNIREILYYPFIGFLIASISYCLYFFYFQTPKVSKLMDENRELILRYKMVESSINEAAEKLENIKEREKVVYGSILGIDSTTKHIDQYYQASRSSYIGNRYEDMLDDLWDKLNFMEVEIYNSSISLDSMQVLSVDKERMLASLPAIWPIDRHKLRGNIGAFGRRFHPVLHVYKMHEGADFALNRGSNIYATANGTIASTGYQSGYGITVLIDHGYGYKTRYAHLQKSLVEKGDKVIRGEVIAESGNTGRSTGPHLHYEVIFNGHPVNPLNFFSQEMKDEEFYKIINSAKETTYEQ